MTPQPLLPDLQTLLEDCARVSQEAANKVEEVQGLLQKMAEYQERIRKVLAPTMHG